MWTYEDYMYMCMCVCMYMYVYVFHSLMGSSDSLPTFSSSYDPPKSPLTDKKGSSSLPPRPLIPLINQSASANKKLMEPASKSDFKPTPQWVSSACEHVHSYFHDM